MAGNCRPGNRVSSLPAGVMPAACSSASTMLAMFGASVSLVGQQYSRFWWRSTEGESGRLPPGCHWVLDRYATLAHTIDALGWLTVWLSVVSERWLATLLLRCGAGAEVLEPERFADLAPRHAHEALARYR